MSDTTDNDRKREMGVEFGPLVRHLEEYEYPATSDEIVETYGDAVLTLQSGDQTLREVFESMATASFTSAEDVRQAIFNRVDERAIGRKAYSDRTPPTHGEETESRNESF